MKKKLLLLLLITMIFVSGCSIKKVEDLSPAEKFSKEYSVPKDNAFKYYEYMMFKGSKFKSDSSKLIYDEATGRITQMVFNLDV